MVGKMNWKGFLILARTPVPRLYPTPNNIRLQITKYNEICSNDDPRLKLTYFIGSSDWSHRLLNGEKVKKCIFQKTLVVYDMRLGTI